ncbi:endoglucanase B [Coprinopsis marcescibilis]|uniref:AA9 family lytic polysaccharide monooxygenase n=1 Tax=Coprinopsis marcescibilis TaxID=230819 RepID=A0A5C3KTN8_COPMA|nr:endoglucanase B [Coprinopsis marcescibilis]
MRSFLLLFTASVASAHTLVRSVYVNGVDQGTNFGIRPPAMNGPPRAGEPPFIDGADSGTGSWPVRNLNLPDLRCNIFGEKEAPDTIRVNPGDVVSFEWGHRNRGPSDGIIEASHKGAIAVYLAPAPGGDNSWVKIFEEGEYSKGQWAVVPKLVNNRGVHSVRIPNNLKSGFYLLRPELFTLHEADVAHTANANRGIQLYMECIQIYVGGNGTVTLPQGVSFPGAYSYNSPGIVYNCNIVYNPPASAYKVPGPTVWAGAAPSVANPPLGAKKGPLTYTRWNTWVGPTDRIVTATGAGGMTKTAYNPVWPTATAWGLNAAEAGE